MSSVARTVVPDAASAPLVRRRSRPLPATLVVGLAFAVVLAVCALAAPWLAPYEPNRPLPGQSLEPPGPTFALGSDSIGRDVLSRVIFGSRISLIVAIPSVALALAAGLVLGLAAGYIGGRVDQGIMRVLDVAFAFPVILLAMTLVAVFGPSIPNLILTIGLIYTPAMARVVRAPVLAVKRIDYVEAIRSVGAADGRIVFRHVLPNILSPVIVQTTLALSRAIFTETALSFLGVGPPPPDPTWGSMLSQSRQFMEFAPWTAVAPGVAITIATMTFILIGNGLRDRLDPRRTRARV